MTAPVRGIWARCCWCLAARRTPGGRRSRPRSPICWCVPLYSWAVAAPASKRQAVTLHRHCSARVKRRGSQRCPYQHVARVLHAQRGHQVRGKSRHSSLPSRIRTKAALVAPTSRGFSLHLGGWLEALRGVEPPLRLLLGREWGLWMIKRFTASTRAAVGPDGWYGQGPATPWACPHRRKAKGALQSSSARMRTSSSA
jgi:hypothetical protein